MMTSEPLTWAGRMFRFFWFLDLFLRFFDHKKMQALMKVTHTFWMYWQSWSGVFRNGVFFVGSILKMKKRIWICSFSPQNFSGNLVFHTTIFINISQASFCLVPLFFVAVLTGWDKALFFSLCFCFCVCWVTKKESKKRESKRQNHKKRDVKIENKTGFFGWSIKTADQGKFKQMWWFSVSKQKQMFLHPTTNARTMHSFLFSLMIGWLFELLQFCFVEWTAFLEQKMSSQMTKQA